MTGPGAPRKASELALRTATGLVLGAVAIAAIVLGGDLFWVLLSAAALVMLTEWAAMIRVERWRRWLALIGLGIALLLEQPHLEVPVVAALPWLIGASLLVGLITRRARLALGMLYAGLPVLALFFLRDQYDGVALSIWALIVVIATDIGAYFTGRAIGGPKLAPALSPNKTWAGLIGGIVAASLVGLGLGHVFHVPQALTAFSGVLAIAAQAGDLYESAMKRRAGVKDSGHVLPGHGGVMDRLDGMVPVVTIVALIVLTGML
ncbi:phosphatidate cytidylyltransferase [Sphingomonas morindae]|uniref:Phosphatidate cytidylyltransferase n=1 Tax=Sphingomonas morindae TaxID=1541170 RepID=A0ABY4X6F7_9SPHN|nr:phosphatidate cytidylyltransferase [Sphingomonas morindae]USI72502.1 phosphatidate cytidylyltransferase [Sphingomonas morindae]